MDTIEIPIVKLLFLLLTSILISNIKHIII